jgi:anti-anti-sigma factor
LGETIILIECDHRRYDRALRVVGDLDEASAPQLLAGVGRSILRGYGNLVLDLADVSSCDADGWAAVIELRTLCRELGGDLAVDGVAGTSHGRPSAGLRAAILRRAGDRAEAPAI